MRRIPSYIVERLKKKIQTQETNSNVSTHAIITRPTTVLKDKEYLEKLEISAGSITDCSIAVQHPRAKRRNREIDILYIQNKICKWKKSSVQYLMQDHNFLDMGINEPAIKCSICYDGTMPTNKDTSVDFITDKTPWLFWQTETGSVTAQKGLDQTSRIELVASNCTDISVIRATWNFDKYFEYGIVLFFILQGVIYHRQFVNGVWEDAKPLGFGPSEEWIEITTSRTWDYRIVIQAKSKTGKMYEIFSEYQGFGKNVEEHATQVDVRGIKVKDSWIEIKDLPPVKSENEHLDVCIEPRIFGGGLSYPEEPSIISAKNIDNGSGDWGRDVFISFTRNALIHYSKWDENHTSFVLTDSRGVKYTSSKVTYNFTHPYELIVTFKNINSARGECIIEYVPGTLITSASVSLVNTKLSFVPTNLNPPTTPPPKPISASNTTDGKTITIELDRPVVNSDVSDNFDKFNIYVIKPPYPNDELEPIKHARVPISCEYGSDKSKIVLYFGSGNQQSIQNFNDCATHIEYGGGTLMDDNDYVNSFDFVFTPTDMKAKNDQCDLEHTSINLENLELVSNFIEIKDLPPVKSGEEHSALVDIRSLTVVSILTKVDDV